MKSYLFLFCCLGLLCGCFRGQKTHNEEASLQDVEQCPNCLFPLRQTESEKTVLTDNPSSEPARDEKGNIRMNWRFWADFDGDGLESMAVSEACSFAAVSLLVAPPLCRRKGTSVGVPASAGYGEWWQGHAAA
jgi:hypothetical protein